MNEPVTATEDLRSLPVENTQMVPHKGLFEPQIISGLCHQWLVYNADHMNEPVTATEDLRSLPVENTQMVPHKGLFEPQIISGLCHQWLVYNDVSENSRRKYTQWLKSFAQWIRGQGIEEPVREDIIRYRDELAREKQPTVSENSRRKYTQWLKSFAQWIRGQGIEEPVREDIIRYRDELAREKQPTTVNNYLRAVKSFYRFLETAGIRKDITRGIRAMKLESGFRKGYLNEEQCAQVIETQTDEPAPDESEAARERQRLTRARNRALLILIMTTGLRTIEVRRADYGDIQIQGHSRILYVQGKGKSEKARNRALLILIMTTGLRTIEVRRADYGDIQIQGHSRILYVQGKGKSEKGQYVKIPDETWECLKEYLRMRGPLQARDPLFASVSNRDSGERLTTRSISRICKDALVKADLNSSRLTAHSLRHTNATLALKNGASVEQVQQVLRHANINTTMIYVHDIDREQNAAEDLVARAIFDELTPDSR